MLKGPITQCINHFLREHGQQLNTEKTTITNLKQGFNFVGFHFKLFRFANAKSGSGYTFLVQPTKANIKKIKVKVKRVVTASKNSSATDQITQLNPILMGWANYYNSVNSTKAYKKVGHYVWKSLWKWCLVKHPKNLSQNPIQTILHYYWESKMAILWDSWYE